MKSNPRIKKLLAQVLCAVVVVMSSVGCAHRIEMLRTSPAVTPLTSTALPIPSGNLVSAYLSVRIFGGELDRDEIYPNPCKSARFAIWISRGRYKALWITPYIDVPRQLLEETGLFSRIVDVTHDEGQIPVGSTEHFLIKLDIGGEQDIHFFRNGIIKNPMLTGLLFLWLPHREDLDSIMRLSVCRWDGELREYSAVASAAAYYYGWSPGDSEAAEENLKKQVTEQSVEIIQQQMLNDFSFYVIDRDKERNKGKADPLPERGSVKSLNYE